MRRKLFTLLAAISLLLCVAMLALWVRSYFVHSVLHYSRGDVGNEDVESFAGFNHGAFVWARVSQPIALRSRSNPPSMVGVGPVSQWGDMGGITQGGPWIRFHEYHDDGPDGRRHITQWNLIFPLWMLVALAGIFPTVRWSGALRRKLRGRAGCCRVCGYDLRATPERCPECGMIPPAPADSF